MKRGTENKLTTFNMKNSMFLPKGTCPLFKMLIKDRDDSELYDPSKKLRLAIHAVFLYPRNLLQDDMTLSKIHWIISQTSLENEEALTSPCQKLKYTQQSNHLVPCHTGSSTEWRKWPAQDSSTDQRTILNLHFPNQTVQSHTSTCFLTKSFS